MVRIVNCEWMYRSALALISSKLGRAANGGVASGRIASCEWIDRSPLAIISSKLGRVANCRVANG
jgi:hypothetical protein